MTSPLEELTQAQKEEFEQIKHERLEQERFERAFVRLARNGEFGSDFRMIVYTLINDPQRWAGVFAEVYDDNPQRMAWREGLRAGGVRLMQFFLRVAPTEFRRAQDEFFSRHGELMKLLAAMRTQE